MDEEAYGESLRRLSVVVADEILGLRIEEERSLSTLSFRNSSDDRSASLSFRLAIEVAISNEKCATYLVEVTFEAVETFLAVRTKNLSTSPKFRLQNSARRREPGNGEQVDSHLPR